MPLFLSNFDVFQIDLSFWKECQTCENVGNYLKINVNIKRTKILNNYKFSKTFKIQLFMHDCIEFQTTENCGAVVVL